MTQREQLYLTSKAVTAGAAEDALERNIRPQGFRPLRGFCSSHVLREHPGGVTLTQLHQELGLAKATPFPGGENHCGKRAICGRRCAGRTSASGCSPPRRSCESSGRSWSGQSAGPTRPCANWKLRMKGRDTT